MCLLHFRKYLSVICSSLPEVWWAAMLMLCIFHWPASASKDFFPEHVLCLWPVFSLLHPSLLSFETQCKISLAVVCHRRLNMAGESCPISHETTAFQTSCCQHHYQRGNISCWSTCFGLSGRYLHYFQWKCNIFCLKQTFFRLSLHFSSKKALIRSPLSYHCSAPPAI